MTTPLHSRIELRVRVDECDGTRAAKPGSLFALVDEARFELYEGLPRAGAKMPSRHIAKAERFRIHRAPQSRELVTVEAWIGRVGRTSLDVAQRIRDTEGTTLVELVSTLVAMPPRDAAEPNVPIAFDETVHAHAHAPLDLEQDAPDAPDHGAAMLRTVDAWPSHENQGRHLARTRIVDWLNDARRIGVASGAFEHAHASDAGALTFASFVFEREAFAGDGLRIAIATSAPGRFDATLVRGKEVVARARLRTT